MIRSYNYYYKFHELIDSVIMAPSNYIHILGQYIKFNIFHLAHHMELFNKLSHKIKKEMCEINS